jgi:hypothetical protein
MSDTTEPNHDWSQDLRSRVKQLTQPLVDSLDSRMREQVDHRVDERVDEQIDQKIDAAISARLSVMERAIADLDRAVRELEQRPRS